MVSGYICNVERAMSSLSDLLQEKEVESTNGINCPIRRRGYASKSLLGLSTADSNTW